MSSEWVRYGADHIVGYVDDVKTLEINPSRVMVPTPTANMHATTKKYVDEAIIAASSGSLPSDLTLHKLTVNLLKVTGQCQIPSPVQITDAATKGYVDAAVVAASGDFATTSYVDNAVGSVTSDIEVFRPTVDLLVNGTRQMLVMRFRRIGANTVLMSWDTVHGTPSTTITVTTNDGWIPARYQPGHVTVGATMIGDDNGYRTAKVGISNLGAGDTVQWHVGHSTGSLVGEVWIYPGSMIYEIY